MPYRYRFNNCLKSIAEISVASDIPIFTLYPLVREFNLSPGDDIGPALLRKLARAPVRKSYRYKGKLMSLPDIAKATGISKSTLVTRIKVLGIEVEKNIGPALKKAPCGAQSKNFYRYRGRLRTVLVISVSQGISVDALYKRLSRLGIKPGSDVGAALRL